MKKKIILAIFLFLATLINGMVPDSAEAGSVVIASDDWIFTNTGFSSRPVDTSNFAINLAEYLTGDNIGKIHAYSDFQSLTQSSLINTLNNAGYTYTTGYGISFDLETLSQYDALFFSSGLSTAGLDVLEDYVTGGGSVYIHAGLGMSNPSGAATAWNGFLSQYGMGFGTYFIGLGGATNISSTHPLFDGVSSLYMLNGHPITGDNIIATTTSGTPLFAANAVPIPGAGSAPEPSAIPEPATMLLFGLGLLGLAGGNRKKQQ
ncbi:PEP-CTERM sorting domain-containing protein [Desulfobacter hydrogenophilus]|nr:PEP-CTERM sorting domain-containing protein [Desulfobacter hydrogenophilus]NDY73092.1 PEP-CTERM sorting domain-containing protein [Desulfobacter hydrogenophilus]